MKLATCLQGWLLILIGICLQPVHANDVLPSWNDTPSKQAIVQFISTVIDQNSKHFVEPSERIAVFDNDGTLWSEYPIYFQAYFIFDRINALSAQHPEWKTQEPFSSALRGDIKAALASGEKGLLTMMAATHTGMSASEFEEIAGRWIATAKHPTTGRRFTAMVYQPMLELLAYLRSNGFKTFIVSGGGVEFMRAWVEPVYGIPPEQVIGSRVKTELVVREGKPIIMRLPELEFLDDKAGKPIGIHQAIGRRPIMAFGNSDGDLEMLQWVTAGPGPRFAALVHHTDAAREAAYDRTSSVGKLDKALDAAKAQHWTLIDMKRDWTTVYPELEAGGR